MRERNGQESECFGSFVVLMAGRDEVFYDGSDPYVSVTSTKATNFAEVFDGIMQSTAKLNNEYIMICIVDNFMDEEEFSDIVENSMAQHTDIPRE